MIFSNIFLTISFSGKYPIVFCNIFNQLSYFLKLLQTTFVRPFHLVVFEHKGHIVEIVAALFITTKLLLIHGVPCWVAREAGPAGQSRRPAHLVAGVAGPAGQKL